MQDRIRALGQDFRHACRALRHAPGYTAWVVGTLAIGMAVTIAALALLNASLRLPFPGIHDQHRLVRVSVSRNCGRPDCWTPMASPAHYAALRDGLTGVQSLAAYAFGDVAAALPAARAMQGVFASASYFDVLGVRPALGRTFVAADAEARTPIAVIAHHVWTREFDSDPGVLGRSIRVADEFVQIVGVAPEHFSGIDRIRRGGRAPDIWLPLWLADRVRPLTAAERRPGEPDFSCVGRLNEAVDVAEVRAEAEVLAQRLAGASGEPAAGGRAEVDRVWRVRPRSWHFAVVIVMPIPILVLAIACVNAANLMLARGSQRQQEIAIRLAIGAGRARIVRQLLFESAVLAGVATAVAVPLAFWGLELAGSPLNLPIPLDRVVVAASIVAAAGTTLAFGLAPAIRASALRPSSTLGSAGAHGDGHPRDSRMRRLILAAQVALSLGLLVTAWQLVDTVHAQDVFGGTPADRLLIARFDLEPLNLDVAEVESFYRDLVGGASRLSGVEAAGLARHTSVWTFGQGARPASTVVWRPDDEAEDGRVTIGGYAGGDLFAAVGLRVLAGRAFTDEDRRRRPEVAVVNESFARAMNGPALGMMLRVASRREDFLAAIDVRIVGVIEAAREPRLEGGDAPLPKIYLPSPIGPEPALALYVRTTDLAGAAAEPLRRLVSRIDPRVPVVEMGSLAALNERSYAEQLWLARGAAVLGTIGLLLATGGLYGVSSYVAGLRSREFAIRLALGATPHLIVRMVLGQSMRIAVLGLLAGGAGAMAVTRFIQSEYHGITGIDWLAFGGSALLFLAAMLFASALPALRASRVDPIESLK